MESLDVVKDIEPGLSMSLVLASVDPLPLQQPEEALCGSIIGTAPNGTHRAGEVVANEKPLVLVARELTTSIRMKNYWLFILPLPERHQHGLEDKLAVLATAHRPSNDNAGMQVNDNTEVNRPGFVGGSIVCEDGGGAPDQARASSGHA